MKELEQSIKRAADQETKERLQRALQSLQSREHARLESLRKEEILREVKQKAKDQIARGEKPFFVKKSEVKKLVLEDKFKQLKDENKLDKAMKKRRKKNASKEKKRIPRARAET